MKGKPKISLFSGGNLSYVMVVCIAVIFASISMWLEGGVFERFLGDLHPVLMLVLAGTIGFLGLQYTSKNSGTQLLKVFPCKKTGYLLIMALAFGMTAIVIDVFAPLSPDINIPFPVSLFFYPAIGLIVEMLFHVLPVSLLYFIFHTFSIFPGAKKRLIVALFLTAFLEPLYQVNMMHEPAGLTFVIGLHILLINLAQMWFFKRFGFFSMFLLRLFYYMIWHVGWGCLRLFVLF